MKIALVFCGQGRNVLEAYKSIKEHIIDIYDTDIYCHLWWDENIKNNGYFGNNRNYNVDENTPDIIRNLYSPKKYLIDTPITDWNKPEFKNIKCPSFQTFLSQLYSIQKACDLLKWDEYDFILKWRYDLQIFNFPNLHKLDKQKFYTGCDNGDFYYDDPYFFSDLGYILPRDMKIFTQIIDNMNNFKLFNNCIPESTIFTTLKMLNFYERMIRLKSDEFFFDVIR